MLSRVGAVLLAALLAPDVFAETIAVSEPQAYQTGISKEELVRLRELYETCLRKAGATVLPAYGKDVTLKGVEFVTSLSVGREGEDYVVTAQVSRIRLDRWSSRAASRAKVTDTASQESAFTEMASGITEAILNAPPRTAAQPPRKIRPGRIRPAAAEEDVEPEEEPQVEKTTKKKAAAPAEEESEEKEPTDDAEAEPAEAE